MTNPSPATGAKPKGSIRETLISIVIAFAMAFVFRGFVVEAFLIPTGSMAPTLLGAHMRFKSPSSGFEWAVDTRDRSVFSGEPFPIQGSTTPIRGLSRENPGAAVSPRPIEVHDPMTRDTITRTNVPVSWGDRIFVLKYLYSIYDPQRFDVVVFKNPNDPAQNYIKRLIGLPNEMVALVDGDVFTRPLAPADRDIANPWLLDGWTVARKPERVQHALWQPIADSTFVPLGDTSRRRSAWVPARAEDAPHWTIGVARSFTYAAPAPSAIQWDNAFRAIDDSYAYNEFAVRVARYPVADLRLAAGVEVAAPDTTVSPVVRTRGREFRADISGKTAVLRMKRLAAVQPDPASPAHLATPESDWTELARATLASPLAPGRVVNIEFWHVDQALTLFVDGVRVADAAYPMSPDERLRAALGISAEQAASNPASLLADFGAYRPPVVRWEFSAGPVTMHRVSLARDIHYQAATSGTQPGAAQPHARDGRPALATHPTSTMLLGPDQFFVCGDNSPSSLDSRLWDAPHPWVAQVDNTIGVVHRDLLIGKAFWVYFPAPYRRQGIPVPDFARMRFIW